MYFHTMTSRRQPHRALVEHEVRLHHVEHAGPREAHQRGEGREGERQRRAAPGAGARRRRSVPSPASDGVDEEEAGDAGRREALEPSVERRPAEPHGEEELEHDAEPEARDGEARHRDHAERVVEQRVAPDRREPRRAGMPTTTETIIATSVSSMVAGRRCARSSAIGRVVKRLVPMSPRTSRLDVVDELDGQRPVEPELAAERLDLRGRRGVARDQRHRIGGDDARDDERDASSPSSVGTNHASRRRTRASSLIDRRAKRGPRLHPRVTRVGRGRRVTSRSRPSASPGRCRWG